MSQTFHIACPETKKTLWIGQGSGIMTTLYSDPRNIETLTRFLVEHENKTLIFYCDDVPDEERMNWEVFELG